VVPGVEIDEVARGRLQVGVDDRAFSVTVSGVIPVRALAGRDLAVLQLEDLVG
jgi:hypothetical protein